MIMYGKFSNQALQYRNSLLMSEFYQFLLLEKNTIKSVLRGTRLSSFLSKSPIFFTLNTVILIYPGLDCEPF